MLTRNNQRKRRNRAMWCCDCEQFVFEP